MNKLKLNYSLETSDLRQPNLNKITIYSRFLMVKNFCFFLYGMEWHIVNAYRNDRGHFAIQKTLDQIKEHYCLRKMRRYRSKKCYCILY